MEILDTSHTKSRREIEEYRSLKKANKVDGPVRKTADYYMTEAGQLELGERTKKRDDPKSRMTSSLNILEYASQDVSSMDMDNNKWVCIDLTADSGACDSVMPRKEPCEKMKIYPLMQSEWGCSMKLQTLRHSRASERGGLRFGPNARNRPRPWRSRLPTCINPCFP